MTAMATYTLRGKIKRFFRRVFTNKGWPAPKVVNYSDERNWLKRHADSLRR
jgi:hypothetical protein